MEFKDREEIDQGLDLSLLDQIQPSKIELEYNPSIETIRKQILIINEFSDKCGITLTLKKKFHSVDPKIMHRAIAKKLRNSRIWQQYKWILFPEFTKSGVLHYHGVIYDVYQLNAIQLSQWWRRTYGFTKLELKIQVFSNWSKYITKDYGKVGLWTLYNIKDLKK